MARTLQRSLLPPSLSPPEGLDASAHYHTASADDVGGDFYDLFPLTHDKWAFVIGDVSGKGAGAAAVTSLTRYTLRAAAVFDDDPVSVLQNLHAVLSQEFRDTVNQFATVIFGVLTPHDGEFDVDLASAGIFLRSCSAPTAGHVTWTRSVASPSAFPWSRSSLLPDFDSGRATRWFSTPTG